MYASSRPRSYVSLVFSPEHTYKFQFLVQFHLFPVTAVFFIFMKTRVKHTTARPLFGWLCEITLQYFVSQKDTATGHCWESNPCSVVPPCDKRTTPPLSKTTGQKVDLREEQVESTLRLQPSDIHARHCTQKNDGRRPQTVKCSQCALFGKGTYKLHSGYHTFTTLRRFAVSYLHQFRPNVLRCEWRCTCTAEREVLQP